MADLDHIETWIFDLDNTLYPASVNLFAQIDVRIKTFIADALKITPEDAFTLQKRYYHEHGTSLRGLMLHHDVDPDAFLNYVHDIDHSVLGPNAELEKALVALPGRKFIHTNGSAYHARSVMDRLGVGGHFSGIFDVRAGNYIPKPHPDSYAGLIARHGVDPKRAVMFEDLHINLKPAAGFGMTTVWIRHAGNHAAADEDLSHCHHVTDDLIGWLNGRR